MSQLEMMSLERVQVEERAFISRVYLWMTAALMLTAVVASAVANDAAFMLQLATTGLIWVFFVAEILLVIALGAAINRLSTTAATAIFFAYAALNGVTLSLIFWVYTDASIAVTFLVTAGTFGVMSLIGFVTQRDLTRLGGLLIMGLIGFLIASVVNLFLRSEGIYWLTTFAGIAIFVGLVAYDTQKLKRMAVTVQANGEVAHKASIVGALALYLDFINLFLLLLRLFGRRR
jgi:hypothetical protein